MKNEILLKRLIELKNTLNESDREWIDQCISKNFRPVNVDNVAVKLINLILDVKEGVELDYANKIGVADRLRAAKRILKNNPSHRELLQYTYTDESGIQNICDSYRMVRLTEPLNLPELPAEMEYVNVKRIMPKQVNPITLTLPTLGELKSYIKIKKAEKVKPISYRFGENTPSVNAEYLFDIMTLVPDAVATFEKFSIVFKNEKGDYALLCILRDNDA